MEGFYKAVVQRLICGVGNELCAPPDQKVTVVVENPNTVGNILLLGIRRKSGRFGQSNCIGRRLVRAESEILGQLTGSLETTEVKQAGSEIDDIAGSSNNRCRSASCWGYGPRGKGSESSRWT